MILMPELCYYCREELNFADMTLHDGHRVHKKCLPPTNDTNKWDEAARESAKTIRSIADDIASEQKCRYTISQQVIEDTISKHHADLRATYDALVELAWAVQNHQANHGGLTTFCSWCDNIDVLLANPLVQTAIERSRG